MFFDRRCPVCGQPHRTVCVACIDRFDLLPSVAVPGIDRLTPLFRYDDASARLILAAKNGGRRDLLRWVGDLLGAAVSADALASGAVRPPDVVTWVPAHPEQRRTRGYDQGELLARAVARRVRCRARPLLVRRGGASRKGLARADRLHGPEVSARRSVEGRVLLVDDVMATGTSLERCAEVLRHAGAASVSAAIVAASTSKSSGARARIGHTIYIGSSSGIRPEAT